jgi:hypothetical protein
VNQGGLKMFSSLGHNICIVYHLSFRRPGWDRTNDQPIMSSRQALLEAAFRMNCD